MSYAHWSATGSIIGACLVFGPAGRQYVFGSHGDQLCCVITSYISRVSMSLSSSTNLGVD